MIKKPIAPIRLKPALSAISGLILLVTNIQRALTRIEVSSQYVLVYKNDTNIIFPENRPLTEVQTNVSLADPNQTQKKSSKMALKGCSPKRLNLTNFEGKLPGEASLAPSKQKLLLWPARRC